MKRFWDKVKKSDGCWEWQSVMKPNGYGWFVWNRKAWSAHRVAWILIHGPIPDKMVIAHTCDNRACVKPAHLRLWTQSENLKDMWGKGRHRNNLAKLSINKVQQIKKDINFVPVRVIADKYGVVPKTIRNIKRGVTWQNA